MYLTVWSRRLVQFLKYIHFIYMNKYSCSHSGRYFRVFLFVAFNRFISPFLSVKLPFLYRYTFLQYIYNFTFCFVSLIFSLHLSLLRVARQRDGFNKLVEDYSFEFSPGPYCSRDGRSYQIDM